jgi:hypothetical protein
MQSLSRIHLFENLPSNVKSLDSEAAHANELHDALANLQLFSAECAMRAHYAFAALGVAAGEEHCCCTADVHTAAGPVSRPIFRKTTKNGCPSGERSALRMMGD